MKLGMLTLDGSQGEGGGQILRTSLTLSLITGQPFRIHSIRAGRRKPGLMRQHLAAVRAAARIGSAQMSGDELGSQELVFEPRALTTGDHRFAIGSAGSACLVLQTILPAMWSARAPSTIEIEGGTHNPLCPPFDALDESYFPLLERMGVRLRAELVRHGFFPAGGGLVRVHVEPAKLEPIELVERGAPLAHSAHALVANLPRTIAERELEVVRRRLAWKLEQLHVEEIEGSAGPGNTVSIRLRHENVNEVITSFGERALSAESVANRAAGAARRYLASSAPVGEHLADQLMLPFALAGGGAFRTGPLSPHAVTNLDVIRKFLPLAIRTESVGEDTWVRFG